jgi:hypothetical protein
MCVPIRSRPRNLCLVPHHIAKAVCRLFFVLFTDRMFRLPVLPLSEVTTRAFLANSSFLESVLLIRLLPGALVLYQAPSRGSSVFQALIYTSWAFGRSGQLAFLLFRHRSSGAPSFQAIWFCNRSCLAFMVDCEIRLLARVSIQAGFDAISKDHTFRDHGLLAFFCGISWCWGIYPTSCLRAVSTIVA